MTWFKLTFIKFKTGVIDAGIATEDNLEMIRNKGYDYMCVSRSTHSVS